MEESFLCVGICTSEGTELCTIYSKTSCRKVIWNWLFPSWCCNCLLSASSDMGLFRSALRGREAFFIHVTSWFEDCSLSLPTITLQRDHTYPGTPNSTCSKAFYEAHWHAVLTPLFLKAVVKNAVLENQLNSKSHAKQPWFEVLDLFKSFLRTLPQTRIETEIYGCSMNFLSSTGDSLAASW